ncbi:MAG: hypothetical protein DRH51_06990 [Candidatus Coatesbacteria bacterium]|nr:MAG: hypothetical protein DRH51_06990 [Candidatus Coatesbacteria bacterium]RLC41093.1 MAG: hypothetical protein DRH49_06025 [Candidatus Coatesbacteria bacterium]
MKHSKKTWVEEIEVHIGELVDTVNKLIRECNVRRLIIKTTDGRFLLEIPLTAGIVTGSVIAVLAPALAALGAITAILTRVKIQIVREEEEGEKKKDKKKSSNKSK